MRRVLLGGGVLLLCALSWWRFGSGGARAGDPIPKTAEGSAPVHRAPARPKRAPLAVKRPEAPVQPAAPVAPAAPKARYAPPGDDDNPVVGLSLAPLSEAERVRLKLPEKYGRGLRVTRIHPDAPAAEVGMKVGDVIIRAQRVNVDEEAQLREAAVSVKYPLILFSRDGELLTAVLHPPYRPERARAGDDPADGVR